MVGERYREQYIKGRQEEGKEKGGGKGREEGLCRWMEEGREVMLVDEGREGGLKDMSGCDFDSKHQNQR